MFDSMKVQQLVEKGWYNESAATINLKCNEIVYKRFTKETERLSLIKDKSNILPLY